MELGGTEHIQPTNSGVTSDATTLKRSMQLAAG
jgi:hypothetical protein